MKYERTPAFKADWARLSDSEKRIFRDAVRNRFAPACDRRRENAAEVWPASLRVKPVISAPGVFEMTWSFRNPDGRATFQWVDIEGEPRIRWRRVGTHAIFNRP